MVVAQDGTALEVENLTIELTDEVFEHAVMVPAARSEAAERVAGRWYETCIFRRERLQEKGPR